MKIICSNCGSTANLSAGTWKCECGGAWEPVQSDDFDPGQIEAQDFSIWRYRKLYGLDFDHPSVRLGEGWTPLVTIGAGERSFLAKLEFMSPTGSFKDRGTSLMINVLAHQSVKCVVDDSSGNAGASVAAYAARAGMQADIFVPAHASASKQTQIGVYGAHVHPVAGPREQAKLAAQEAARAGAGSGVVYASHAYNPAYLLGQESAAWELWEQLGHQAPDWIVSPTAQGGNLLGYFLGFMRLFKAGLVSKLPHLVAVQSRLTAPIYEAWQAGLDDVPAVEALGTSLAEGIAITQPVRGKLLMRALRETDGLCVAVSEDEIIAAQNKLARAGIWVEPTSAAAAAGLEAVFSQAAPGEKVVVSLTGSGLKGAPKVQSSS